MHTPGRGDGALRRYRVSLPDTSYFLTLCTEERAEGLTREKIATTIVTELSAIEAAGHWTQRAGVLMPDHLHLLVCISGQLPIARCVARLKSKTCSTMQTHGLSWQTNFYEHRIRSDAVVQDVLRYIFLNPYRGGVVSRETPYRWFWLGDAEKTWFQT